MHEENEYESRYPLQWEKAVFNPVDYKELAAYLCSPVFSFGGAPMIFLCHVRDRNGEVSF